jgi:3-oxoacyl-[acyl-carrier protein] reductase
MDLELRGKRALVCGSTQGIGKAVAIELASLGAHVTLMARNKDALENTQKELPVMHQQRHEYLVADFNFPEQVASVAREYAKNNVIHILVNNSGGPPGGEIIDAKSDDFIRAFSRLVLCNQVLAQCVVPGMKKERFGRIINIISTSVKVPIKGLGVSNTIRAAVANWSKTLSLELGQYGITVNNVLPGSTLTGRLDEIMKSRSEKTGRSFEDIKNEMVGEIPVGRLAAPNEIAVAAAFLATPAAGYINGINIPVDGGRTGSL